MCTGLAMTCLSGPTVFADVHYDTEITGAGDDSKLSDLLDDVSQLKSLEDKLPASEEVLRRRADADLDRLKDAAHSLGYWDAQFSYKLDSSADPIKVTVTADPGPLYHVASIQVLGPDGKPLSVPLDASAPPLPLAKGDAAQSEPVVATENALLGALGHSGHPFAKKGDRRVVVDHAAKTMEITYKLDPGPTMRFGAASIGGLERLNPTYVQNRIQWQDGQQYDNQQVEATRKRLIESGLFSTVKITPVTDPADPNSAHMQIDATERSHRTVGAGAAYNTSEGPGARLFWENRNLFGNAEYLRVTADGGQQRTGLSANFRRPDFLAVDQDLLATAEIADDTPDAYHSRHARVSLGIERRLDPGLTLGAALSVEKANVVQEANLDTFAASEQTQHYALIGVPLLLKLDRSDDLLNPTRGYRAQLNLIPYKSFSGPDLTFVSGRISASTYQRLTDSDRYIIAAFAAFSSVDGVSLAELPADKRIYAGGGGSIRAYGYQKAGQLDSNNNPIGGRSSMELSLEARIKITESIGIVPFIDAGSYYSSSLPQISHRLLYGPGIGFRYYTPFGPVRLDIATPFNRRHGDSLAQFYISLGQAF
ncbi:MAG TPA: BamA/TamA family outer membrane protein [Stellaceae bacterium]|nr:BamA/TamA family outer membrane protein [Stellaceae bacterium]